MSRPWTPEVEVPPELAARLIRTQFPEVGATVLRELGAGWDNVAYVVDDRWVFRFPRREIAVPFLRAELRWLPTLAPELPTPVSAARFQGEPSDDFAWPFGGYPLLRGDTLCSRELLPSERGRLARDLASFLRALHAIDVPPPGADVPVDSMLRMDLVRRIPIARRLADEVADRTTEIEWEWLLGVLSELATTPAPEGERRWTHGDLYVRHLLVDDAGRLSGVIDWGDMHVGEAAVDLAAVFALFTPDERRAFFDVYGPVDESVRRRARGRALFHSTALVHYGVAGPEPALLRAGVEGVSNALAGY